MQRRSTLAVLLAAGSAMAWALVFLTPGDDLAFPWLQVTLALVIIVAAAAVAVGKIRLPVAFLATWLPLGLLGVWNVATSDALGAVGAVVWLAVSAIVTGAVVVTVAMIKNSANRPVHNTPKPE